jgi:hypothetical protein
VLHPIIRRTAARRPWRLTLLTVVALVASACTIVEPPIPPPAGKLLYGIGTELNGAKETALAKQSSLAMYTSWYNGPDNLGFMSGWKTGHVPEAYASGRHLHLVVWTGGSEGPVSTKYGTGCGRAYPLSDRFLGDMKQLAEIFKGPKEGPSLFVTLFTEFQTFPCTDNQWNPNTQTNNYLRALKDRYTEARNVFKSNAPNAKVSLGWGGWQARWDSPGTGGGRSMFKHFEDVMKASDFQSFQNMGSNHTDNLSDIRAMTKTLGAYGPVMMAHYKPGSLTTFEADLGALFTDSSVASLKKDGLFAFNFMDDKWVASGSGLQTAKNVVAKYGAMR